MEEHNKYDDDIIDVDELEGTDIKINPDYYIHNALLKAQKSLTNENVKEGVLQFKILVEHIEVLCKAANMVTDSYHEEVKKYLSSGEYKSIDNDIIRMAKSANKKIELLMSEVFKGKLTTAPLKL